MINPNTINSKSDINNILEKHLNELANYMQEDICKRDCFSYEQSQAMDDLCKNIFYYLSDLKDAIELLNK